MIKKVIAILFIVSVITGCSGKNTALSNQVISAPTEDMLPTVTLVPSATPIPTQAPTNTPVPTETPVPTPTSTLIPFDGFLKDFRFYRTWKDDGTTVVYFLNAGIVQELFGKIDETVFTCAPDEKFPRSLVCRSEVVIPLEDKARMDFFADQNLQQLVHTEEFVVPPGLVPVYNYANNCPDRGKNVFCEAEYRQYENYCSTSITCHDACGYYYSIDNLPENPDAPWVPTGSCP